MSINRTATILVFIFGIGFFYGCSKEEKLEEAVTKENVANHLSESYENFSDKNYKESIKHSSGVIEFNPDSPEAYFNRGIAKYKTNDKRGALKDLNKAKELYTLKRNEVGIELVNRTIDEVSPPKKSKYK